MPKKESATVLIVDDDPIILTLVEEQISLYGYQPIVASSGEEALRAAEKQTKIDLLLTDVIMPGINGLDLARQFIVLHPGTRVLFMSGHVSPPSMDRYGIPDSKYGFLQKPFGTETLINHIKNVLNGPTVPSKDQLDS